jgi:hypothetical protein
MLKTDDGGGWHDVQRPSVDKQAAGWISWNDGSDLPGLANGQAGVPKPRNLETLSPLNSAGRIRMVQK